MTIGQKIKEARIAAGLTQEALGKIVGVQKSAIAKYENGKIVNIKRSTVQKLARALNMKPSDFIFDESPKQTASQHVRILTDFELMESIRIYYELDSEKQKMIRELIRAMK